MSKILTLWSTFRATYTAFECMIREGGDFVVFKEPGFHFTIAKNRAIPIVIQILNILVQTEGNTIIQSSAIYMGQPEKQVIALFTWIDYS